MKIPRDITYYINFALQHMFPPIIRDRKWFLWLPFKLVYGRNARMMYEFKSRIMNMTDEEFANAYRITETWSIHGETDLNNACIDAILKHLKGETVLDVGCGRGYLADRMSQTHKVSGVDVNVHKGLRERFPQIAFHEGFVEKLPFPDGSFDTVVCTHTLEHTRDISKAISELRRVARLRVITVVPMERPYRYTFNLHLHFFPYPFQFLLLMGKKAKQGYESLKGDLFYYEDKE